jgi:hypothetical protein
VKGTYELNTNVRDILRFGFTDWACAGSGTGKNRIA